MRTLSLFFVALALAAACGEPLGLPPPNVPNRVDSLISLYALSRTPISTPSAYIIRFRQAVRTDQSSQGFDFAFDIDSTGRPLLLPTGALKLAKGSGIQLTLHAFDSVTVAPSSGYNIDSGTVVDSGAVAILHSGALVCSTGMTSVYYAKLHVVAIDTAERRIDFVILNNVNCGYRGLEPGLPKR
jgi:hypothetical protein